MRFAPQDKLALHPQLADHLAGKKIYPVGIEISPSGVCSAHCSFCFYADGELGGFRKVFLDLRVLRDVLYGASGLGVKAITWTGGGDPSLYPDIGEATDIAASRKMSQGMFTNALALPRFDPSLLDWIRVTITDKPVKPKCIKALRGAKTLGIAFNYSGCEDDEKLADTLKTAEQVGADYVQLRPALAFHGQTVDITPPYWNKHPLLQITEYKFEEAKKKHGYKKCEGYKFVPFLWEDGNVDVCAYHRKDEGYTLGNVYKDSLKDILDRAPQSVPVIPNCQVACKLHEINVMVDRLRHLEDVNFP